MGFEWAVVSDELTEKFRELKDPGLGYSLSASMFFEDTYSSMNIDRPYAVFLLFYFISKHMQFH